LLSSTDRIPTQATACALHSVAPFPQVMRLPVHQHSDAVHAFQQLEDPPPGWPRSRGGPPCACRALVGAQRATSALRLAPHCGPCRQGGVRRRRRLTALGRHRPQWRLDGGPGTRRRWVAGRRSAGPGGRGRAPQPAGGQAVVPHRQTVIAGRRGQTRPPGPPTCRGAALRPQRAAPRHAGATAPRGTRGGSGLGGPCGLGAQRPGRWGTRPGRPQGRRPLLDHRCRRRLARPPWAPQGSAPLVGHPPGSHGLRHVWPMGCGRAVGEAQGVLVARGDIGATEGQAGGAMMAAWRQAFLGTASPRPRTPPQSPP
jgi:hypothetical protein